MEFEKKMTVEELRRELDIPEPPQPTASPLPTKEYHVVDPDTGQVVGTIDAPLAFCDPLSCEAAASKRNPMGFINPLDNTKDVRDLWVHQWCMRPTLAWWQATWDSMVLSNGTRLPWQ